MPRAVCNILSHHSISVETPVRERRVQVVSQKMHEMAQVYACIATMHAGCAAGASGACILQQLLDL